MITNDITRAAFIFLLTGIVTIGLSQTKSWDGGGSNDNWHTSCNWNPDGVPACTDIVTIGTGNTVNIATGTIAHCEVLNLQGTADLNIQGTGKLEVSSSNSCVGTASSTSTGCTVPSTSWSVNGTNRSLNGCFSKYCICPCPNTGPETYETTVTNNTSATITITPPAAPGFNCAWFLWPSATMAPGASTTIRLQSSFSCCPANGFHTFTWSGSDAGSGSFQVEVCNVL